MKVTIDQLKQGIGRYIDAEFTSKLQGFRKWIIPLGAAAIVNSKIDSLLTEKNYEMLHSTGYISEDGMVDIDRLFMDLSRVAREQGSVTENIPMIGDVTFSEADIASLRRHITS